MEGDFIKINEWMLPLSWLYGLGVRLRNQLFELGILKSRSFDIPVISVGNITVGGSGKTPHVEYLIRLLKSNSKVAVLSRGYKRKSKGYVLAGKDTRMRDIGDEPYQMKTKFPDIHVAVDKSRCHGIDMLTSGEATKDTDVILLDDAFQHRYVKPGINILLVDYHRLIIYDKLLPAGRLREPQKGKSRADIVIITKCPKDLKPMEYRVIIKAMDLYPYQQLYFTSLEYDDLNPVFGSSKRPLGSIGKAENILLLAGIASPKQLAYDLGEYSSNITQMTFPDHHQFTAKDIERINATFDAITEKLSFGGASDADVLYADGLRSISINRDGEYTDVDVESLYHAIHESERVRSFIAENFSGNSLEGNSGEIADTAAGKEGVC